MKRSILLAAILVGVLGCESNHKDDPTAPPAELGTYTVKQAFPGLPAIDNLVELQSATDGTARLFALSQKGVIYEFDNAADVKSKNVFLDISGKVNFSGEMGLLGLAFSPNYKTDGYFYINYVRKNPGLETVIARYKVNPANPNIADPNSEEILLTYAQPFENHKGGKLAFGPDEFLYIATGDGGSAGDPNKNGQNNKQLLGKILRIDPTKAGVNTKYDIPGDNLFKGNKDGNREEIYAYGMRNPWRFSFDRTTGTLWCADVGQDKVEEIDIIEKGGNYGWSTMEGNECFKTSNCNTTGLEPPVYTYVHGALGASITGGYVCRDKSLPGLNGRYIYGDYASGNIWALTTSGKTVKSNDLLITVTAGSLSSFGEDGNGGLYILNYKDGKIYKLEQTK